jgi:hypothetical protein
VQSSSIIIIDMEKKSRAEREKNSAFALQVMTSIMRTRPFLLSSW